MHTVNTIFSALFAIIIYIRTCIHAGVHVTTLPSFCESTCEDSEIFSRGCWGIFEFSRGCEKCFWQFNYKYVNLINLRNLNFPRGALPTPHTPPPPPNPLSSISTQGVHQMGRCLAVFRLLKILKNFCKETVISERGLNYPYSVDLFF